MYSSEDLERFYFQYQTESFPKGESIQKFCLKNKVLFILNISADQKDRYIAYLADRVTDLDLNKYAMELVLEDFLKTQQELR